MKTDHQLLVNREEFNAQETTSKRIIRAVMFLCFLSLVLMANSLKAQPEPPGGGVNPTPIDGMVGVVLAVGAGYVAMKKKRNTQ